jgi:hypothetical protein
VKLLCSYQCTLQQLGLAWNGFHPSCWLTNQFNGSSRLLDNSAEPSCQLCGSTQLTRPFSHWPVLTVRLTGPFSLVEQLENWNILRTRPFTWPDYSADCTIQLTGPFRRLDHWADWTFRRLTMQLIGPFRRLNHSVDWTIQFTGPFRRLDHSADWTIQLTGLSVSWVVSLQAREASVL